MTDSDGESIAREIEKDVVTPSFLTVIGSRSLGEEERVHLEVRRGRLKCSCFFGLLRSPRVVSEWGEFIVHRG
jgi:hypothetical protein